jgi:hypothetical protein
MLTRESLDVPLPRPGKRFVEIVDVEHETPLRRGEDAEVRQVGVAAALDCHARPGRGRQVMSHDPRRPAVERERRDEHPPVADRHQLGDTRLRLLLEQLDRVETVGRRLEHAVARARHLCTRGLPAGRSFLDREVRENGARLSLRDSGHPPMFATCETRNVIRSG